MARLRLIRLILALALTALCGREGFALTFPPLTGRIVDEAQLLDAGAKAELEQKLQSLEDKTSTQLVIVTLPSLQDQDIADYGYQLGRHWGIGQKGSNNGVLLIIAPNERKVRIEVGYGLEGTLTDAVSRLIIDNAILPRFRAKDYAGGIMRGTDDLIQVLSGDAEEFQKRAEKEKDDDDPGAFFFTLLFLGIWIYVFTSSFRRRKGGWFTGSSTGSSWSSGGGGWPSGGGGFSGGGGSFGGGGSSGSW